MNSKQLAILASAYNVCGPRAGVPATPATVVAMASPADLYAMACDYCAHVQRDRDAIFTAAEVIEAMNALCAGV